MGTNTVLELMSWRDVEFVEGRFDFSELDTILSRADYMACASFFYGWERSKTAFVFRKPEPALSLIIELEPSRFLFIGTGYNVLFASTSPTAVYTDVLHAEEKRVVDAENGLLETERRLDGDETSSGL
ncbi:hypothetical protein EDB80DRAFT_875686 [Ilyonectria destructans]|nr:hypothetical protein EDB80DRAFT_875686 [Ilyonectria destructans]